MGKKVYILLAISVIFLLLLAVGFLFFISRPSNVFHHPTNLAIAQTSTPLISTQTSLPPIPSTRLTIPTVATLPTASPSPTLEQVARSTPTIGKIIGDNCVFDTEAAYTHIRPEHLTALQPQFRSKASLPIAPTLYEMTVTVNLDAKTFNGQAIITFWNRAPQTMPNLVLRDYANFFKAQGGQVTFTNAILNDKRVLMQNPSLTYLAIPLSEPIAPCSRATLKLDFEGQFPVRLQEDVYAVGTFYAGEGFFALSNFYPQLAVWEKPPAKPSWDWTVTPLRPSSDLTASEVAFFDVQLQIPPTYQLVGSGVAAPSGNPASGYKAWRLVGGPLREFAVFGGENFNDKPLIGKTQGNVAVKVITNKISDSAASNRQKDFAQKALAVTIATLDEFGAAIAPYPYTEYTLLEYPLIGFNGYEFPMFSPFSFALFRNSYTGREETFENLTYSKPGTLVVIHEVLHQWWYNLVGNDQQLEPFIDEGITEYCAYLIPELQARHKGTSVQAAQAFTQSWLDKLRTRLLQEDLPTFGDMVVNAPATTFNISQAGLVLYRKAPLFYDAYRAKLGDQAFFNFLKLYFQHNQFKVVHYSDLLAALIEAAPGRAAEVQALANSWFNQKNLTKDL